jgi:hypothetical protein
VNGQILMCEKKHGNIPSTMDKLGNTFSHVFFWGEHMQKIWENRGKHLVPLEMLAAFPRKNDLCIRSWIVGLCGG